MVLVLRSKKIQMLFAESILKHPYCLQTFNDGMLFVTLGSFVEIETIPESLYSLSEYFV